MNWVNTVLKPTPCRALNANNLPLSLSEGERDDKLMGRDGEEWAGGEMEEQGEEKNAIVEVQFKSIKLDFPAQTFFLSASNVCC